MKKILPAAVIAATFALASCGSVHDSYPVVFAHRGGWLGDVQTPSRVTEYYVPENSLDGIRMAARMGYPTIELDVHWTLDSVLVCMHDGTINRTMRNAADQSAIESPVAVKSTSFEDLRTKYALASTDPGMRRCIPTLEEMLDECARCGIKPIMHCDIYEGYERAVPILGDNFICFSSNFDVCRRTRGISSCLILLDPGKELTARGMEATPANVLSLLDEIGGDTGISSMKYEMCAPEMTEAMHAAGHPVQSSIFPTPHEADAVRNGADILLSDFCWRPAKGMKPARSITLRSSGGDEAATASFDECELGALTITLTGKGSCTVTVEELAATGASETRTYEFCGTDDAPAITERLSYRFWKTAPTVRLTAAEGSSFKLKAALYNL